MIFYKITQSKNSLSKEGETLYFAKTIITGKTDTNPDYALEKKSWIGCI